MKVHALVILLSILMAASGAAAQPAYDSETMTIVDYIDEFIDIPAGAIDWKTLGETGETESTAKDEQGTEYTYVKPAFTPAVKALDGQIVTIKGYIFPLDGDEKQKQFLIGPFPVSCPFHYHVGPALIVEVNAAAHPVKFSYDPVIIRGRMEIVHDDPEFSTFYRLHDAQEIK